MGWWGGVLGWCGGVGGVELVELFKESDTLSVHHVYYVSEAKANKQTK